MVHQFVVIDQQVELYDKFVYRVECVDCSPNGLLREIFNLAVTNSSVGVAGQLLRKMD